MQLDLGRRTLDLGAPVVMAVLNRTPDSFSDGGCHLDLDVALRAAERMLVEGAVIIDVGGESTRPGAATVSADEEVDRVVPLIEAIHARLDCIVSVDTMKPPVMAAACAAGAELVNDVNGLRAEGALQAVRAAGTAACIMHMQGQPRTMQQNPRYDDVVGEVAGFLRERVEAAEAAGIPTERLCLDPGFGFGKRLRHNLALLAGLEEIALLGRPLLVGLSRKSMLGEITGRAVGDRVAAGVAAALAAVGAGARVVRTHDVAATVDALAVWRALNEEKLQGVRDVA